MRWHLLNTYDKIYTIDLHGNSKKKETAPDGSADVNVFDIMQGVSINIFIKTDKKKNKELGKVFHCDLYGKREAKYAFLSENNFNNVNFTELKHNKPYYFFVPKKDDGRITFENGFKINEIFSLNNTGIVTGIDRLSIFLSKVELETTLLEIITSENPYDKFKIEDTRRTTKEGRIEELRNAYKKGVVKINYRPFDTRYTLPFTLNEHWINSPRTDVMQHFLKGENIGLICPKQVPDKENSGAFITKYISGHKTSSAYNINNIFPLYLYPENNVQQTIGQSTERTPNLNPVIVKQIADNLGMTFTIEKEPTKGTFSPIDILDYIYAVQHSPTYREKYKEFLKIDFPRVPYPKDAAIFWQLVNLGSQIRQIHLLESPTVEQYITQYPIDGDNIVTKPTYQNGKVYINDTQYFNNVPQVAWEFYIGGYQPAQKWLKDRKDRKLEFEDILHYQKIIVALTETDRLMKEINKIDIE
jgi:predicted helicase